MTETNTESIPYSSPFVTMRSTDEEARWFAKGISDVLTVKVIGAGASTRCYFRSEVKAVTRTLAQNS